MTPLILTIDLVKIALVLFVVLTAVAYLTYAERRLSAFILIHSTQFMIRLWTRSMFSLAICNSNAGHEQTEQWPLLPAES